MSVEAKPVTLKQFPEKLYREAKAQAALLGITLPDLFKKAVEEFLKRRRNGRKEA